MLIEFWLELARRCDRWRSRRRGRKGHRNGERGLDGPFVGAVSMLADSDVYRDQAVISWSGSDDPSFRRLEGCDKNPNSGRD